MNVLVTYLYQIIHACAPHPPGVCVCVCVCVCVYLYQQLSSLLLLKALHCAGKQMRPVSEHVFLTVLMHSRGEENKKQAHINHQRCNCSDAKEPIDQSFCPLAFSRQLQMLWKFSVLCVYVCVCERERARERVREATGSGGRGGPEAARERWTGSARVSMSLLFCGTCQRFATTFDMLFQT